MNFKCKNCGGYTVYSPKYKKMYCPFCDSKDSHEKTGNRSLTICPSCNAELKIGIHDSSTQCPYCNNYIIFDERVENEFKPDYIIPFEFDIEDAKKAIEEEYKKNVFIPSAFLSEKKLSEVTGNYVPFFLYDFKANAKYNGTATTVKTWTSGNYTYTKTSYYNIARDMDAAYDDIPADASEKMPDEIMDLLEPYDYSKRIDFDPMYMSGFLGEKYNQTMESYKDRAANKANSSIQKLLSDSITGYSSLNPPVSNTTIFKEMQSVKYALFPVYAYKYKWKDKEYAIYVNGQTKKIIGTPPISKGKLFGYSCSFFVIITLILEMVMRILGGWL